VDERDVVFATGGSSATAPRPDWRRAIRLYDDEVLDERALRVSLAVPLVDAFTGGSPRGDPSVSIDGSTATPIRNASGQFVFVDLDLDPGDVTVTVDGGAYYADPEPVDVTIPTEAELAAAETSGADVFDPSADPVGVDELVPTPTYPFPPGTTLVRGRVVDDTGATPVRVPDAQVGVDGVDRVTTTTDDGEYVVCFARAEAVSVVRDGGAWLVRVGGTDPTITAEATGLGTHAVTVSVPAGRTTVVDLVYE
jgi:hypothetical protein